MKKTDENFKIEYSFINNGYVTTPFFLTCYVNYTRIDFIVSLIFTVISFNKIIMEKIARAI